MEKTTAKNNDKMPEGMGWRVAVSIVALFASIAGTIVWLLFYAENFNVYRNIAIIAVILLGFVAVMGATWAPWSMRQGTRWNNNNRNGSKSSC